MDSVTAHLSVKKSIGFMVAGLLIFVLYLYYFVGFEEISAVIQQVNLKEYFLYYSLTIIAMVLSVLFYSLVWHELLKSLSLNIGLKKAFLYSWVGNFVDLVLPLETVTGELTRAFLVQRDLKNHMGETLASLICHRILSIFTTLSGLICSSLYLIFQYNLEINILYLLIGTTLGSAFTLFVLLYLLKGKVAASRLINLLIRLAGIVLRDQSRLNSWTERAKGVLNKFNESAKTFGRNPRVLIKPILYSYVSWFLHLVIYFLVFYALGFANAIRYIPQMIVVQSVTLAVQGAIIGLPFGPTDIVMESLFTLFFGFQHKAISGTATLLIRVITFWLQILMGYTITQLLGTQHLLNIGSSKPHKVSAKNV